LHGSAAESAECLSARQAAALFPFPFYFNYTGFIVTCSAATPSHNAIRGFLSPRPRARESPSRGINPQTRRRRDLDACGVKIFMEFSLPNLVSL